MPWITARPGLRKIYSVYKSTQPLFQPLAEVCWHKPVNILEQLSSQPARIILRETNAVICASLKQMFASQGFLGVPSELALHYTSLKTDP